jgi:phosphoglycerate dehydrogenase-like enzyme
MAAAKLRIAVLDDFEKLADTVPAYEALRSRADLTILGERLDCREKIRQKLGDAECLLLMRERTPFSAEDFQLIPRLRFVSQTGRTSKHLDMEHLAARRIPVSGTPSDNGGPTKELTVGLIVGLMRRIAEVDRRMRSESWPAIPGRLIEGKTLGVLGFGRIGKEVARIMVAFRMRVLAYSRTLTDADAAAVGAERVEFETLLKESDVVTIHIPLNANTRGTIGEEEIQMMKPGALIVNTSRGPIISEAALVSALKSGHLGGAGLDVYGTEPLPMDHPLASLDNVVLTPHIGWGTETNFGRMLDNVVEAVLRFLDGDTTHVLNPAALARRAAPAAEA